MSVANNSAGRLHAALVRIFSEDVHSDNPLEPVLANAFDAKAPRQVAEQVSQLNSVLGQIERDLTAAGLMAKGWMEPWDGQLVRFTNLVAQHGLQVSRRTLEGSSGWLSEQSLGQLGMCADLLASRAAREELSDDELDAIREQVSELRARVTTADAVSPHLRALLLAYVERLERALSHVRLYGVDGLADAVDQGLGIFVQEAERVRQSDAPDNENDRGLLSKLQGFLTAAARTLHLTRQVAIEAGVDPDRAMKALGAAAQKAIEG